MPLCLRVGHELLGGPTCWPRRVRHLIHHTSALPPIDDTYTGSGNEGVLESLRKSAGPSRQPGTAYAYSNVGYVCLAEILSRISDHPVANLARSELFTPLDMAASTLSSGLGLNRAGHEPPPTTIGDGGLWTTAEDLHRWNVAMNTAAFGHTVHHRAETPGTLDDGTRLDYAWGVRVIDHQGRRTLSHGGSWPTWSAKTVRQPDQGTSVAILTASEDTQAVTAVALDTATTLTR